MGEGLSLTKRVLDVLDVTAIKVLERNHQPQNGLKNIYVDVSQSIMRNTYTNLDNISPCLTTSTELYSFGHDRVILPQEMMAMHGYQRITVPETILPRDLKTMVGGGMSLPCIGTVLMALHVMQQGRTDRTVIEVLDDET